MKRSYYALRYRLDTSEAFLLWYSNEVDGVIVDDQKRALSFGDVDALQRWTRALGWVVNTEGGVLHDLDAVERWSQHPSTHTVDCGAVLDAWNLFIDIRCSIEQRNVIRDDPENDDLYDKVFWGNNLPSMTPPGEHYVPVWSDEEIARLSGILAEGMRQFRASLRPVAAD